MMQCGRLRNWTGYLFSKTCHSTSAGRDLYSLCFYSGEETLLATVVQVLKFCACVNKIQKIVN